MTIEIIFYFGDLQQLKLTLNNCGNSVDRFIIIEPKKNTEGKQTPRFFFRQERYVEKYWPKIDYYLVDDIHDEEGINKILESYGVTQKTPEGV